MSKTKDPSESISLNLSFENTEVFNVFIGALEKSKEGLSKADMEMINEIVQFSKSKIEKKETLKKDQALLEQFQEKIDEIQIGLVDALSVVTPNKTTAGDIKNLLIFAEKSYAQLLMCDDRVERASFLKEEPLTKEERVMITADLDMIARGGTPKLEITKRDIPKDIDQKLLPKPNPSKYKDVVSDLLKEIPKAAKENVHAASWMVFFADALSRADTEAVVGHWQNGHALPHAVFGNPPYDAMPGSFWGAISSIKQERFDATPDKKENQSKGRSTSKKVSQKVKMS